MANNKRLFSINGPHGPGGVFFSWQRTSGGFLATTGYDQIVNIYNRHAEIVDQIRLPGMCCCFGWDKDGDLLAVITDKSSNLLLWDANTQRSQWLDSGKSILARRNRYSHIEDSHLHTQVIARRKPHS